MKYSQILARLLAVAVMLPAIASAAWTLEPTHTNIAFEVDHLGLTKTPGQFRKFDAQVTFDEVNVEKSRVTFTIETASIDTLSTARDTELRGEKWLDAGRFPNITFASRSVRRVDANRIVISGDLTIRGKTLPVDFEARITNRIENPFLKVPSVGLVASTNIRRTAFGVAEYLPAIGDEVTLRVQTELNKAP